MSSLGLFKFTPGRPGGRSAVPIDKQLLIFLWYIGSLEPLCRIADRFNVTEFSVLRIHKRICQAVLSNFKTKYIVWPNDQHERQTVIDTFTNKRGFPGVTGAIDSTHTNSTCRRTTTDLCKPKRIPFHNSSVCVQRRHAIHTLFCRMARKLP